MNESFIIKEFSREYLSDLVGLKKICEEEAKWVAPDCYLEEWSKVVMGIHKIDANLIKLAFMDDNLVGYCISVKDLHNYDGVVLDITWGSAYIWDLFVLKEHRSKGIGKALLNQTIEYMKSIGKDKVGLLVNYWNDPARKFFEKLDFKLWSHFLVKRIKTTEKPVISLYSNSTQRLLQWK